MASAPEHSVKVCKLTTAQVLFPLWPSETFSRWTPFNGRQHVLFMQPGGGITETIHANKNVTTCFSPRLYVLMAPSTDSSTVGSAKFTAVCDKEDVLFCTRGNGK